MDTAPDDQRDGLLGIGKLANVTPASSVMIYYLVSPAGAVSHHVEPPPLPDDWVAVPHVSGATIYLHKPSRVVTLSRPYRVSTSNTIKVKVTEILPPSFPSSSLTNFSPLYTLSTEA